MYFYLKQMLLVQIISTHKNRNKMETMLITAAKNEVKNLK